MKVFDFDHDFIDDVVLIDEEGKWIIVAWKRTVDYSKSDPLWDEDVIIDIS